MRLDTTTDYKKTVAYYTAAGFCVPIKGVMTDTIEADRTGCLDVPDYPKDPDIEEVWIYAWYTAASEITAPVSVPWSKIKVQNSDEVMKLDTETSFTTYGPISKEFAYQVCIKGNQDVNTVLHIRIGGPGEEP